MSRIMRRGHGPALGLLGMQMLAAGPIPPVTLATIALNCAIFYNFFNTSLLSPRNSCLGLYQVMYLQEYPRLVLAAFVHMDEWHLYYNMVSLLFKGKFLENKHGSSYFAVLMAIFTVLTGVVYLVINKVAADIFDAGYVTQCAAGFSGVLFALKVVKAHESPNDSQYAMGIIAVSAKYLAWVELLLIQLIAPNASFNGHLAGILVGVTYVYGPLKTWINWVFGSLGERDLYFSIFTSASSQSLGSRSSKALDPSYIPRRPFNPRWQRSAPSYTYASGTASNGYPNRQSDNLDLSDLRQRRQERYAPSMPQPETYSNEGSRRYTYMTGTSGSRGQSSPKQIDLEELRRRRTERFQ